MCNQGREGLLISVFRYLHPALPNLMTRWAAFCEGMGSFCQNEGLALPCLGQRFGYPGVRRVELPQRIPRLTGSQVVDLTKPRRLTPLPKGSLSSP